MKRNHDVGWLVALLALVSIIGFVGDVAAEQETSAQAGEKIAVPAQYVRVAENDEGWVVVGYKIANQSVKEEWMLLDVGITVLPEANSQKLTRDQVKLVTPESQVISLPSAEEYADARASLAAMTQRADMMGDSINYFPPGADQPCRIGFFSDPSKRMQSLAYDEVELSPQRACLGRLYFQVPGGIQYGTYNLDVQLAQSVVKVPFRIMTKEQAKEFEKELKKAQKAAKQKK